MNLPEHSAKDIFAEALRLTNAAEREAYLDRSCAGNLALRQEVESLLNAYAQAGDFLGPTMSLLEPEIAREHAGIRIGRYKLLEQIGEGGFGVVWMAEQEEPVRRRVALKIIKLGMDTREVVARFEAERQALAMMEHPNIARVFDGGATDTGRPYFVMELVKGIPITSYCDANKLATQERLELFMQVCHAVQHAHQKGVIHRDLKPSNILVTVQDDRPVPKVIDFGVAKATQARLTEKTVFTQFRQWIGTPSYMSPEQAGLGSLDVDTRSDVYSLGVLLYELLTGRTPFDTQKLLEKGYEAVMQTIREEEPPKPSTRLSTLAGAELSAVAASRGAEPARLNRLVRGDLDWIVMKALEKDRKRRYETASALAHDLECHLGEEPVMACPPSSLYRFQKLVRRNKLAFTATAAVATALILGLGLSTWLFFREKQARQRAVAAEVGQVRLRQQAEANEKKARTAAAKSQQVALFLKDMLKGVGPSVALGRDTVMLREIVDQTAGRISQDLKDQPEVQIELGLTLAAVYRDLQLHNKMEQTACETLRLARAHLGEENLAVADALGQVGHALMLLRVVDEAETFTRQAIAMQRKLRGVDSLEEAASLRNLADVLRNQWFNATPRDRSKLIEAESAVRKALAIRRSRLGSEDREVAFTLDCLSIVLNVAERREEAEAASREGLAIRQKLFGEDHPETGQSWMWLGNVLRGSTNRLPEAEDCLRKALAIQRKMQGPGKWFQAYTLSFLAGVVECRGKPNEAEDLWREALAIARAQMGEDSAHLPHFILSLSSILRKNGKAAEAQSLAKEAAALNPRGGVK